MKRIIKLIKLRILIHRANNMSIETGKRHFVIEIAGGKRVIVDNSFVKVFNKNALRTKKKTIKFIDLEKHCIYMTPLCGVN